MLEKIKKQIENINQSIEWIREYRPEDYGQRFLQLVEERRKLKRIESAMANNPGIAAFGKSQVGKSYLISCLLQGKAADGKDVPFTVRSADKSYNFVYKINPPSEEGGGRESTGVVSRFSSFKRYPELHSYELPVLVKTFTVTDIILTISDSYYNDFDDYTCPSETDIKKLCQEWEDTYKSAAVRRDGVVCADDILNIKMYFEKHINKAQSLFRTPVFDKLALLIDKIPVTDYEKVFPNFWNKKQEFNELFRKLLSILQTFDFADTLYLPIGSVLHEGIRENTIMSVQCLKQLFAESSQYVSDVYVRVNEKFEKRATGMPKSEICAICSEVIYKIEEDFLSSERPYKWQNMSAEVQKVITHDNVKMEMLSDNDLLDFPGARAREQEHLTKLSKSNILDFFLRGKVAYLFNKYNEEMGINILLYCHHNKDNDVTGLYKLLEDWVHNYVGDTVEARKEKLDITGISPLFYIGTMFNLDMEFGKGTEMTKESINQRWTGRFDTVVNTQCFHRETTDWVKNWTCAGEDFKNSYVLRDYKFSTNLYEGFEESGHETSSKMSDDYFKMMRETFVESKFVGLLFADPAMAWDVAATMENDGALYIIENLTKVAARMDKARNSDADKILNTVRTHVYKTMEGYFVPNTIEGVINDHIRKATSIHCEMDFTCDRDNYYFGHLIQALQMTETACYRIVHKIMQSPELNTSVNDFKDYEIIRTSCAEKNHPLDQAKSETEKWQCIILTYGFDNKEEASEFLKRKNVDVTKLFSDTHLRKLNSCIIADAVFDAWCVQIKSVDFMNTFAGDADFDTTVMSSLVEGYISTAEAIYLKDKMAASIAEYVNVIDVHVANENLLADTLASLINDFVSDFGFRWLSADEKKKAQTNCEKYNIPAFNYILKKMPAVYDEEALTAMFNEMSSNEMPSNNKKALLPSFNDNYRKWKEYMFISFIAHLDIPDIKPEQNNKIKALLDSIRVAVA